MIFSSKYAALTAKISTALCCLFLVAATVQAQTHYGELGPGDATHGDGKWYEPYTFEAQAAQMVRIRMTSDAFDTYLLARSPSGVESFNDDYEGERVSQLEFLAPEAGTWTIWATSYGSEMSGSYTLDIELGGVGRVETLSGRLDPSDSVALKGEYYDTHSISIKSPESFVVELVSFGFDGYLVITSPTGQVWRNDDTGSQTLSRIGPVQGEGKWRIDVTSASADEVGAYDVRILTLPSN